MKKYLFTIFLCFMLFLLLSSCRASQSPSDVVKSAYTAANEGKYSQVETYFSNDSLQFIKGSGGAMFGGIKALCDSNTNNCTIENIDILKETIKGEGATVSVKFTFKDKSTKNYDAQLIKKKANGS